MKAEYRLQTSSEDQRLCLLATVEFCQPVATAAEAAPFGPAVTYVVCSWPTLLLVCPRLWIW